MEIRGINTANKLAQFLSTLFLPNSQSAGILDGHFQLVARSEPGGFRDSFGDSHGHAVTPFCKLRLHGYRLPVDT